MNCKNKPFMTKKKAFTLIELLIVIAIIGILFIVLISKVDFATDKAKATGVQTDFRSFQMAFETVAREHAGFSELVDGNYGKLEAAINKNLDAKLHIDIDDSTGEITMLNGAEDPWDNEYHGQYVNGDDGKDRGAIVIYSNGANMLFGSDATIAGEIVTITTTNDAGKDDYAIAVASTYTNGYGEVKTITTGFSKNQSIPVVNSGNNTPDDNIGTDVDTTPEYHESGLPYNSLFMMENSSDGTSMSISFTSNGTFDIFVSAPADVGPGSIAMGLGSLATLVKNPAFGVQDAAYDPLAYTYVINDDLTIDMWMQLMPGEELVHWTSTYDKSTNELTLFMENSDGTIQEQVLQCGEKLTPIKYDTVYYLAERPIDGMPQTLVFKKDGSVYGDGVLIQLNTISAGTFVVGTDDLSGILNGSIDNAIAWITSIDGECITFGTDMSAWYYTQYYEPLQPGHEGECKYVSYVDEMYLKSVATCKSYAQYYKSCSCGAASTSYFSYGDKDPNNHSGKATVISTEEYCCKYACCNVQISEHKYDAVITAPTCEEQGFTTYTCSTCGFVKISDYVDALGHSGNYVLVGTENVHGQYTICGCTDANHIENPIEVRRLDGIDIDGAVIHECTCQYIYTNTTVDNYSWKEIQTLAQANLTSEQYNNIYNIQLGQKKDDKYILVDLDGNDYDGFVFMYNSNTTSMMNPTYSNAGGYVSTKIMKDHVDNLYINFDNTELKSVIKQVAVNCTHGNYTNTLHTCDAYMFLASAKEVGVTLSGYNYSNEGEQFDYFNNHSLADFNQLIDMTDTSDDWWLRTACCYNSSGFSFVSYDGNVGTYAGYITSCVIPCFVIG